MTLRALIDRLDNWGTWARVFPEQGISITGLICDRLAKDAGQTRGRESKPKPEIDEDDARLVEAAWRKLHPHHKTLLKLWYVWRMRREGICRRLRIRPYPASVFDLELAHAQRAMAETLDRGPDSAILRGNNLKPSLPTSEATQGGAVSRGNEAALTD